MAFLTPTTEPSSWLISLVIGVISLITIYILKFYFDRRNYPPGPIPLPLLGNLLRFRNKNCVHDTLVTLGKPHGKVFTLYIGPRPVIFVSDYQVGAEAFKTKALAGRIKSDYMMKVLCGTEGKDIIMSDFDREWEVLRRVAHSATRKYAISDSLVDLVASVMDEAMLLIKDKEGDNPFDPTNYLYLIMFSIIARSAYGSKYTLDDPEFVELKTRDQRFKQIANNLPFLSMFWFMKYIMPNLDKEFLSIFAHRRNLLKTKFHEHVETFEPGTIRDFCDALIAAKKEAEVEDQENAKYLSDANLILTLFDLFIAGTDTTRMMMTWIFLYMANYPDLQTKMRMEIDDVIGDETPNLDHKSRCNYINCFIAETLRINSVAMVGHSAIENTTLGGFPIKKGTDVVLLHNAIHFDEKHWKEPKAFFPERFLDANGVFNMRTCPAFVTFGVGRRACLGEKLAMTDLFLITTRLLQSTKGSMIILPKGPGSVSLDADPDIIAEYIPPRYKVVIKANQ